MKMFVVIQSLGTWRISPPVFTAVTDKADGIRKYWPLHWGFCRSFSGSDPVSQSRRNPLQLERQPVI